MGSGGRPLHSMHYFRMIQGGDTAFSLWSQYSTGLKIQGGSWKKRTTVPKILRSGLVRYEFWACARLCSYGVKGFKNLAFALKSIFGRTSSLPEVNTRRLGPPTIDWFGERIERVRHFILIGPPVIDWFEEEIPHFPCEIDTRPDLV